MDWGVMQRGAEGDCVVVLVVTGLFFCYAAVDCLEPVWRVAW